MRRNDSEHTGSPPTRLNPEIGNRNGSQALRHPRQPLLHEIHIRQVQILLVFDVIIRRRSERLLDADRDGRDKSQMGKESEEDVLEGSEGGAGERGAVLGVAIE